MCKFVNQNHLGAAGKNCRDIHFGDGDVPVHGHAARNDFKVFQARRCFRAPMRFEKPHDHIDMLGVLEPDCLFEHLRGFTYPCAVAEINFQLAAPGIADHFQKIVCVACRIHDVISFSPDIHSHLTRGFSSPFSVCSPATEGSVNRNELPAPS